jgi:hypothetical protein
MEGGPASGVQRITQCGSRERNGYFPIASGPLKEAERALGRCRPQSEALKSETAGPGRAFECAIAADYRGGLGEPVCSRCKAQTAASQRIGIEERAESPSCA